MNQPVADFSSLCKSLARRYRNTQQFDDLVSEGVLACYETLAEGKTAPADFTGAARRAMHDYINVKTKAVSIPTSHGSYTVSHAMSKDKVIDSVEGITEATLLSLTQAMSNLTESATEDTAFTVDHAILYEQTDYYQHIMLVAKETLSTEEMKVLKLRYFGDMTQDEVAEHMKISQKLVSRQEISALAKLKKRLVTIRDV